MAIPANPIDLTTVAAVKSWVGIKADNLADDDNIQRCITAASSYWLWYCGKGPGADGTPNQSPFNEPVAYNENYDGPGGDRMFLRNTPILSVSVLTIGNMTIQQSQQFGQPGFVIDSSGKNLVLRGGGGGSQSFTTNFFGGGAGALFAHGKQNVNVQYVAGFPVLDVTNELQTIPVASGSPARSILTARQLPWLAGVSVKNFGTGIPLTPVLVAPGAGQYFLLGGGQYLFNSADAGTDVLMAYSAAGTPPDVEFAARQMVSVNYKRKEWIDQVSRAMANGAGTVSYRNWELPPEIKSVMNTYRRQAITG
jgi:hypothetical protein